MMKVKCTYSRNESTGKPSRWPEFKVGEIYNATSAGLTPEIFCVYFPTPWNGLNKCDIYTCFRHPAEKDLNVILFANRYYEPDVILFAFEII